MEASDFLIGIAQVGATFVGFSSIVAVFGRASDGSWSAPDRIRVRNLVEQSLFVSILGFLPGAVFQFPFLSAQVWAFSSIVLAVVLGIDSLLWIRRALVLRRLGSWRPWMGIFGVSSLGAALLLQVLNLVNSVEGHGESGPYVAGLLILLLLAGLQFGLLVFGRVAPVSANSAANENRHTLTDSTRHAFLAQIKETN